MCPHLVDGTFASVPLSIVRQQVNLALEGNVVYYSGKNSYPKLYMSREEFFPPVPFETEPAFQWWLHLPDAMGAPLQKRIRP
jgi:hypothetical protein